MKFENLVPGIKPIFVYTGFPLDKEEFIFDIDKRVIYNVCTKNAPKIINEYNGVIFDIQTPLENLHSIEYYGLALYPETELIKLNVYPDNMDCDWTINVESLPFCFLRGNKVFYEIYADGKFTKPVIWQCKLSEIESPVITKQYTLWTRYYVEEGFVYESDKFILCDYCKKGFTDTDINWIENLLKNIDFQKITMIKTSPIDKNWVENLQNILDKNVCKK